MLQSAWERVTKFGSPVCFRASLGRPPTLSVLHEDTDFWAQSSSLLSPSVFGTTLRVMSFYMKDIKSLLKVEFKHQVPFFSLVQDSNVCSFFKPANSSLQCPSGRQFFQHFHPSFSCSSVPTSFFLLQFCGIAERKTMANSCCVEMWIHVKLCQTSTQLSGAL